jgi:hypothetical protein
MQEGACIGKGLRVLLTRSACGGRGCVGCCWAGSSACLAPGAGRVFESPVCDAAPTFFFAMAYFLVMAYFFQPLALLLAAW